MDVAAKPLEWADVLSGEKQKPYFNAILDFVKTERQNGKTVYPPQQDIFNALKLTSFENVKVVILGQDPYHGPNQAHGLAFSVKKGVRTPPSLQNMYKELQDDCGIPIPKDGLLDGWAKQGVLLLNTSLTVLAGQAGSHAGIGWQQFTDRVIDALNQHPDTVVFLLWGSHAQKKGPLITQAHHHILKAPHPSPLSAHRGFFGCKHFSRCNEILTANGRAPIDWSRTHA